MVIDYCDVSACLITKFADYPKRVLDHVSQFPFKEILILPACDGPYRRLDLFQSVSTSYIYSQDDDTIAPIAALFEYATANIINCALKPEHLQSYARTRIALIGWGAIFPKSFIHAVDRYRDKWGEDEIFKREFDRIFTFFNFPQNRLQLPIIDMPWAYAPDRMYRQPQHYENLRIVQERCEALLTDATAA